MNQKSLSNLLKLITVFMGILGLFAFFWIIPELISNMVSQATFLQSYWCWMFLAWVIAIPCYISLFEFYRICHKIGEDMFFSKETVISMKRITKYLNVTAGLILIGMIGLQLAGVPGHPGFMLLLLFIVFVVFAISALSSTLAYLVSKAVDVQEENELTV